MYQYPDILQEAHSYALDVYNRDIPELRGDSSQIWRLLIKTVDIVLDRHFAMNNIVIAQTRKVNLTVS